MQIFEITNEVVEGYVEKVGQERIDFLVNQAKEQIEEIAQDEKVYLDYLNKAQASVKVDKLVLWVLFMSLEDICFDYIEKFNKDFFEETPMNDLADLSMYIVYLTNSKGEKLDGIQYMSESNEQRLKEIDHHSVTNLLLYVQQQKQQAMEF